MSNLNETEMKEYKKSIMEYADVQDACVAAMEDGFAEGEANTKSVQWLLKCRKKAFRFI
jgi:hypothetical protein